MTISGPTSQGLARFARLVAGISIIAGALTAHASSPATGSATSPQAKIPSSTAESVACLAASSGRFPIHWHVGKIDPRFNVNSEQVRRAAERAIRLWEVESGKRLFVYDRKRGFPVVLVFDARQARRHAMRDADLKLAASQAALDEEERMMRDAMDKFKQAQAKVDVDRKLYEAELFNYNLRVEYWNAQGGATPRVAAALDAEKMRLETEKDRLDDAQEEAEGLRQDANLLVDTYNELLARHNSAVRLYNRSLGGAYIEKVGECFMSGRRAKRISIYAFTDLGQLALVLAHEFGHALGLRHVKGNGALMSAVENGGYLSNNLRLTARDRAELRRALRR